VLKDVKHVPHIQINLILIGIINVDGLYSLHGGGRLNLSCDSLIVARGNISSYFYWMQVKVSKDVVYAVENDGSMELWLKRLGHMSDKGIFLLSKKEVIL